MDKETLSNYGWIVIAVLVLVVMIALATPFGSFISEAVQSTTKGLFDVNKNALDAAGVPGLTVNDQEFDVPDMNHGAGETPIVPGEPETPEAPNVIKITTNTVPSSDVTYEYDATNGTYKFTYVGGDDFIGWDFGSLVEAREYDIVDEVDNWIIIKPNNYDGEITVNAVVETQATLLKFGIDIYGKEFTFEEGMTWGEWYESEYCDKSLFKMLTNIDCIGIAQQPQTDPIEFWKEAEYWDMNCLFGDEDITYYTEVDAQILPVTYIF